MSMTLKPISEQVLFITGATNGIGRSVIKLATEKGARVFMVGRNEEELQSIQDEMRRRDLSTAFSVADVAEVDQLQIAADQCMATFGTIDTWINNGDTTDSEMKRLFETNFWGVVNGCKIAASILGQSGGTIINIGCQASKMDSPIQGIYLASLQAIKEYTNGFRLEQKEAKAPISVTLVEAGSDEGTDEMSKMVLKAAEKKISHLSGSSRAFNFGLLKLKWFGDKKPQEHVV